MGDYLRVTTVQVVQALDLAELDKTIRWLVSKVQELPTADQANQRTVADSLLQDQIDALRRENSSLKDVVAQLQSKQDDIESRLDTKQDRDQAPPAASASADTTAAPSTSDSLADLDRRLAAVEQRLDQPASSSTDQPSSSTADAGVEADGGDADVPPPAPGPDLNSQFQELLAGHRALAATVSGLQHELESKPSRGELDLKANRSELDALLKAGVAVPAASGEGAAAPALAVGADGSLDNGALVDAVNKAMAELAAMRGQVAVMQDRVQGKAEQGGLDDLASQLAALKSRGLPSSSRSAAAEAASAAATSSGEGARGATPSAEAIAAAGPSTAVPDLSPVVENIVRRLNDLEARVAAGGPRPGSSPGGSDDQAVDAIGSLTDVQPLLKDIFARVDSKVDRSALEDALRRLQDLSAALDGKADAAALRETAERLEQSIASATAATTSADKPGSASSASGRPGSQPRPPSQTQQQQQQWIVSHELPPDSRVNVALDELRAQVASLAGRVSQLSAAVPAPDAGRASGAVPDFGGDLGGLQAALAALQGQLGELGTRLAGKADAGEVARLELALNGKADVDELGEMRLALGGKAEAAALGELQMALAGKANQQDLDAVKLTAALAADMAAAAGGAPSGDADASGGSGGGYANLLGAINSMVSDKASKAELEVLQGQVAGKASADDVALLRAALDDKASAAELSALQAQLSGRAANSEEIASLDQRMGDVFAELAKIRADMAAIPAEALAGGGSGGASGGGAGAGGEGLQRTVSALSREVGTLREGLDTVAHAANVLAVGLDAGSRMSAAGAPTGGVEGRYGEADGAGKENRSPRGGYERLLKLLGSGDYRHKMDAFDPAALQHMAQKLAYLEATVKSPTMGRAAGVDYGIKELERQVKRLGTDVRLMKDKLIEPAAMGVTGSRINPGDHAMLAARPITGYRCMACDRPLDQLDVSPGPHVPTQQLPLRVPAASDAATRTQVRSGRGDPLSPQGSSQRLQYNNDPNVRAVQNWYKDTQVVAAEVLPKEHVGPHLPPGGWRPSNPGTMAKLPGAQASLPSLNGLKSRSSPTGLDHDPKSPQAGVPMDGVAANVTLPQIS